MDRYQPARNISLCLQGLADSFRNRLVHTLVLEPLDDRVLVRRIPSQRLVTLTDAEPERYCEVIACGLGKKLKHGRRTMGVKPGNVVYLPGIASLEPDYCYGQDILVREDDIGFVVEEV